MSTENVEQKSSAVREHVQLLLRMKAQADDMEEFENHGKVQVNIRLHAFNAFLLDHLAEYLDTPRTDLAVDLLRTAIADAWYEAGLPEPFDDDELKEKARAYIEARLK